MRGRDKEKSRLRAFMGVLRKRGVVHGLTPERLRLVLEDMGPTYVKIGQIMSMRSDVLPEEYCHELEKLRTEVKPLPFGDMLRVVEEEWSVSPYKIFEYIDKKPIGSASIAQAYCAVLKESGKSVVVKIQRPGIYNVMREDVRMMRKLINIVKTFSSKMDIIDFGDVLDELWATAKEEMNFVLEAKHLERFKRLNEGVAYVDCPFVYHKLTTPKVLVMEKIDGYSIDQAEELERAGYDMKEIGAKLAENYSKQVLDDAFFHSDPHQGNIMISGGKIVFIDWGMAGELSEKYRLLMRDAVSAIAQGDIRKLKEAVLTIGKAYGQVNHSKLYSDLEILVKKYVEMNISEMNMGEMMDELLDVCNGQNIALPPAITMLARGLVTLEGVVSQCCPQINMFSIINAHMSESIFENLDLKKELLNLIKNQYNVIKKGIEMPATLADLFSMAIRGELKTNLEIVGSEEPLRKIDSMIFEIIICAIACSLNLGAAILCTTQMEPKILGIPILGLIGYAASIILVVWLIFRTISNRRRKKRKF